jgi:hypothetical protein
MHDATSQDFEKIAIYSPDALEMLVRNAAVHVHVRRERVTCAAMGAGYQIFMGPADRLPRGSIERFEAM